MPAVYDDEKIKDDELGKITGVDPAEEKAMEARANEDLASAEQSGGEPNNDTAADKEKDKLDDQVGGWATNLRDKASGKIKDNIGKNISDVKKKVKYGLAVISIIITIGSGILTFIAGPRLMISHIAELINNVGNMQVHQFRAYRRMKLAQAKRAFTPGGRRANALVNEMKRFGYEPNFDGGKLKGFTSIDGTSSTFGIGTVDEMEDFLNKKYPWKSARWKTKRMNAVYKHLGVPRRSVIVMADDLDESVETILNKRMAEGLIPEDAVKLSADDLDGGTDDEAGADRDAREARNKLAKDIIEEEGLFDDIKKKLKKGTSFNDLAPDERAVLRVAADMAGEDILGFLDQIARSSLSSKAIGFLKSSVTEVPGMICSLKRKLNAAMMAARVFRSRALIGYAAVFITASDQHKKGRASAALTNELVKRLVAPDGNGQYLGASPGFRSLLGKKYSKSDNDAVKSFVSVDGSMTGMAGAVKGSTDLVSNGFCDVVLHPATQVGAAIGEIAIGVFSGGVGKGALAGGGTTAKVAIKEAMETAIKGVFTKRGMASIAGNIAVQMTFEQIAAYIALQGQKSLELPFTGQETGAQLGSILAGSGGAINKQRNLESGMVPATETQMGKAMLTYETWKNEEIKKQSLYTRLFDYDNADSAMFNLASTLAVMPMTPHTLSVSLGGYINDISSFLLRNPSLIIVKLGSMLTPQVFAQASDEIDFDTYKLEGKDTKLAVDSAGNAIPIMRQDIQDIDVDENIDVLISDNQIDSETLEPKEDSTFAKHVQNCVKNMDSFTVLEQEDTTKPENDCMATQEKTVRFKAHLAYLSMMDGIDAWLFPDEIGGSGSGSGGGGSLPDPSTPNPGGLIIGDPYSDTTTVACAPGTIDIGLQDAYISGELFKSRMCSVSNFPSAGQADNPGGQYSTPGADGHAIVNSRVSGAWYKLVDDAKAAGVTLSAGSSFRSMPHQQSLFKGDTSKVARPGYSSHQAGVAIDFNGMSAEGGGTCAARATHSGAGYQWLRANAGNYGFKQYSAEAWHWDALPMANRC